VDISIVDGNSIRLKGKQSTFIVDPSKKMPKTPADAVILLDGEENIDVSRVTDSRIILNGPGEYEVSGVKISGMKTPKGTLYKLSIDGISIILGFATELKTEGFNACQVALVNTGSDFNESFVTALEPKMTILYGEQKLQAAKALGKESAIPVSKVTTSKEKLPVEMEVAVLG